MSLRPYAVPLECPACGGELAGTAQDAALACLRCSTARVSTPGGGESVQLLFAALPPGSRDEAGPALPFWRFDGLKAAGGGGEGGPPCAGAPRALDGLATGFVLAARIRRFQVYGDPGLEYTRRPPRLEPGAPGPLVPIARTREDAARVLRVLLGRIATEADVAEAVTVEPTWERSLLWCVPTVRDGAHVKLPHCPIRFPADLVLGYAGTGASR